MGEGVNIIIKCKKCDNPLYCESNIFLSEVTTKCEPCQCMKNIIDDLENEVHSLEIDLTEVKGVK